MGYSSQLIEKMWLEAAIEQGFNPEIWRKDFAGAWIRRDHYNIRSRYGWRIDHIRPLQNGGTDELNNLQPIHWRNDVQKGVNYPNFTTCVTSDGKTNIYKIKPWQATE